MLKKQRKYCRYRTNTELMQSFLKKGSYWRWSFHKTKLLVRPMQEPTDRAESCWKIAACCSSRVVSRSVHASWTHEVCVLHPAPGSAGSPLPVLWSRFKGIHDDNVAALGTSGPSGDRVCFLSFAVILENVQAEKEAPEVLRLFEKTRGCVPGAVFPLTLPDHKKFSKLCSCSSQKQNLSFKFPLSQGNLAAGKSA